MGKKNCLLEELELSWKIPVFPLPHCYQVAVMKPEEEEVKINSRVLPSSVSVWELVDLVMSVRC